MTTREPEPQPAYLSAYAPAVERISRLDPGQVALLEVVTGGGKSRVLAAAVAAFLDRKPESRALIVTHSLTITQQAEAIEAYRTSVTLIRDKEEMQEWLYHPTTPTNRVVVVTESLIGSTAEAALLDAGFSLSVFADAGPHLLGFAEALSAGGSAVVLIGHSGGFDATWQIRNKFAHATPLPAPLLQDLIDAEPHAPVHRVGFSVEERERDIIAETVALMSDMPSSAAERLQTAALSSRAALSAALVSVRLNHREPNALNRNRSPRPLRTEPGTILSDEEVLQRSDEAVDARLSLPADRVDAILDAIDDLGGDHKLITLARIVADTASANDDLVLFVQNSATARYVEQFLTEHVSGVLPTLWKKSPPREPHQLSLLDDRDVLIVTDRDLVYMGAPLHNCTHVWFDVPSTPRHGRRRAGLRSPGASMLYVLIAEPPLLDEPSRFSRAGLPLPPAAPPSPAKER
ncbi:DEAD/DEAH box helicase family protein [Streptomyces puniciscabiei]